MPTLIETAKDNKAAIGGNLSAPLATDSEQANAPGSGVLRIGGKDNTVNQRFDNSISDYSNTGTQTDVGNIGAGANVTIQTLDGNLALASIAAQQSTAANSLAANLAAQQISLDTAQKLGDRSYAFADEVLRQNSAAYAAQQETTMEALNAGQFAVAAQQSTAANSLAANLAAQQISLDTVQNLVGRSLDNSGNALASNLAAQQISLDATERLMGRSLDTSEKLADRSYDFAASVLDRLDAASAGQQQTTLEVINAARQQTEQAGIRSESAVSEALTKLADQRAPDGAATAATLRQLVIGAVVIALAFFLTRRRNASA